MKILAKTEAEVGQNQRDDFFPAGQQLVLLWRYQQVYGTLWRMAEIGDGLLPEVAKILAEDKSVDPPLVSQGLAQNIDDSVFLDYQARLPRAPMEAEPELFAQLLRAKHTRTIRTLVKRSCWLRGSHLGLFLWQQPDRFLKIKSSPRFPKSSHKQIEFLARRIGALLAGYEPSTGDRYIPGLINWCICCGERPAALGLIREGETDTSWSGRPWCGAC
jgi:hypothetical protein